MNSLRVSAYLLRCPSAKLGEDLAAIDRVIGMFMPDFDPSKIKPVRPRLRYATGMNRKAIAVLREAREPLSTLQIAGAIMTAQGGLFTKKQRSEVVRAVGASLRHLRRIGRVQSERNGLLAWWTIVRDDLALT